MNKEIIKIPLMVDTEVVLLDVQPELVVRAVKDPEYLKELYYQQYEKNVAQIATENEALNKSNEECASSDSDWTNDKILLLIETFRLHEADFDKTIKRNEVWNTIANEMTKNKKFNGLTGSQCSTKFSGLKRTYKKIKDNNSKSGNSRRSWIYFEILDELFANKTWVNPIATASEAGPMPSTSKENITPKKSKDKILEDFIQSTKEYRRDSLKFKEQKEAAKRKRHEERMDMHKSTLEALKKSKN